MLLQLWPPQVSAPDTPHIFNEKENHQGRKERAGCNRAGKILDNERVNGVLMDLAALKQWGIFRTAEQCEAMLALLNHSVY